MEIGDKTVAEMTATQLKALIQSAVKEALQEILEDPDVDLELRPEFEERLRQAVAHVASGGQLLSMEELTGQLEDTNGV
jgi:NADPH:quinone reductase-like Zn-dependent oxidoreductase